MTRIANEGTRSPWVGACAFLALLAAWLAPARAEAAPPPGFQETVAFNGLDNPTAVAFAPGGQVFIAEKSGLIKSYSGLGDTSATTFADLRTEVHNFWDRGLLALELDPDFPSRPYVYVLYTRDALPGGSPPRWGSPGVSGDPCPNPPGATDDGCVVTGRLARIVANGEVAAGAPTPLITDWCQQYPSHSTGDIAFGPDGDLYVSGGDGASFNFTDWGQRGSPQTNPCGDPPGLVGGTMAPPTAEGGALRAQDVRTVSDPTTLDGSLLRIDPDSAAGHPDNPFAGSGDANRNRIVAYGLRNPFRITVRPGTDEVWIGDVGWFTWEEINRVEDADGPAENFGWPCYEGAHGEPWRQPAYDGSGLNLCETLYAPGDPNVTLGHYAFEHGEDVVPGESCGTGTSSSITGLTFYEGGGFPSSYDDALFFADYSRKCIWAMRTGPDGLPDPTDIQLFNPGAADPVDLEVSPQGDLFYAALNGTVRRIAATGDNAPPVAAVTATPDNGPAPLPVELDASGSTDADDEFESLEFEWDYDGDGFDDGTGVTRNEVFDPGTYEIRVRVTDPGSGSDVASVQVSVDNTRPEADITAPASTTTWGVNEVIGFAGTATDDEQTLPASAFDWRIVMNHCPSDCHQHPVEEIEDTKSGSFAAFDHDYPSTVTLELEVTDSGGLTDTDSVTIQPRTADLTLLSSPVSLEIGLNFEVARTPFTRTVIEGSGNTVIAPAPQSLDGQEYLFSSWSDGGEASHDVTVDDDTTLTASFRDDTIPAAPAITGSDPAPPSTDETPLIRGQADADSAVIQLYAGIACAGQPSATGSAGSFRAGGIAVPVPSDLGIAIYARAVDAGGNRSPCSSGFQYTEDSTPPVTRILDGAPRRVFAGPRRAPRKAAGRAKPRIRIAFTAGEAASGFACRLDKKPVRSCRGHVVLTDLKRGKHRFVVRATDVAGNQDPTGDTHFFKVVRKPSPPQPPLE